MDMARLDRATARPLDGPGERPLCELPEPAPSPHERPLRELSEKGDGPIFVFRRDRHEDCTTSAELLLILREVLGDHAVGLAEPAAPQAEADSVLLLDQPLLHPVADAGPSSGGPSSGDQTAVLLLDQPLLETEGLPIPDEVPPACDDDATVPPAPYPPPTDARPHDPYGNSARVPSEGSVARGLFFAVPLSALIWGGLVALVRWLTGR